MRKSIIIFAAFIFLLSFSSCGGLSGKLVDKNNATLSNNTENVFNNENCAMQGDRISDRYRGSRLCYGAGGL